MKAELPSLAIVGPGRVGRAVERAATEAGLEVALAGRGEIGEVCAGADVVLLCVPDAAIGEACDAVVQVARCLRFVGHTSGASGLVPLAGAAERGAATFSIHPLQSVASGDCDLDGVPAAIAGSSEAAIGFARGLASTLGMRPFEIPEESRAAYHAAASIASNFLVTLAESAAEVLRRAGIEDPRELLAPLVLTTAANWAERGSAALTGPIARGDEATVARHVDALAELHPELLEAYLALAQRTRALAGAEAAA